MAGVSREGEYGVRLSPSPIYFIVVIVKKGQPCVAQVILAKSSDAHIFGRRGGECRVGRRTRSEFCFKMNLFKRNYLYDNA